MTKISFKGYIKRFIYSSGRSVLLINLSLIFILFSSTSANAAIYVNQNNTITINKQNTSISDILEEIENASDFLFVYDKSDLYPNPTTSIEVADKNIEDILDLLFQETEINYIVEGYHIILKKEENRLPSLPVSSPQQASTKRIQGVVMEATGEPAIGANVSIKGTTRGTITDINGEFALEVSENDILQFSYIGFLSQEVRVAGNSIFNITLQEDTQLLDEVVVVGYGVQKKVNLTGSVSTISAKSIETRPITNVSSALAGLASGVNVRQTSGRPGDDGAKIRIRGVGTIDTSTSDNKNDALVIIDGVEGVLDAVNPNDIEDISILKDAASAAIYGARAANGVILVTTRKGQAGKPRVNFSGTLSLAQPTRLPQYLTNYADYMELFNEALENVGEGLRYSQSTIDLWREKSRDPNALNEYGIPNYVAYPNTDWADALFENNWVQNYNISVTGGSETSKYAFSVGYLNNPGIMANTGTERYQLRMNLESKVAKFLTLGTNTFVSLQDESVIETGSTLFGSIRQKNPGLYPYQYDGYWAYVSNPEEDTQLSSPVADLYWRDGKDQTRRFNTTLFARIDIWKGLVFETKFNYQARIKDRNVYPVSSSRKNFATNEVTHLPTSPSEMTTNYEWAKNHQLTFDNVLRYNFDINRDHYFGILLGHNEYYYNTASQKASKLGLVAEGIYVPDAANNDNNTFTGTESDRAMRSFFGRFNYDYQSKYMFEFNLRRDGSSRFGSDNRWGTFPSVSGGWRLSEESFFIPLKRHFQNIKLRASWGKLGNDIAGNYDYQANYETFNYSFNNTSMKVLAQKKLANTALKWEETESVDVALELNFLDNRAYTEINYYNKYTRGILTTPNIYLTAGDVTAPTMNTADVLNRGVEITAGWNDQIGRVRYGIKGNFSYNRNEVKKYLGKFEVDGEGVHNLARVSATSGEGYILEDHKIGEFFVRRLHRGNGGYFNADGSVDVNGGPQDGMIRTEQDMAWVLAMQEAGYTFSPVNTIGRGQLYYGDYVYANLNGDKIFGDSNDMEFSGKSPTPKFNYGFAIDLAWNNFDISMIWAGSAGMHYYFRTTGYNSSNIEKRNNFSKLVAEDHYFYNPDDPTDSRTNLYASYPRLQHEERSTNNAKSERWIYNASYLKLKNLQIGYTLPSQLTNKINISHVRVFVSGENLLMFTPYPFMDPEMGSGIGYLPMRQFAFGLNVNF